MQRATWCALLAIAATFCPAQESNKQTIYIAWSVKTPLKLQDWSGKATISQGQILEVVNDSGNVDKIHPDKSWTLVYGRSLAGKPDVRPGGKGLWITVDASADAVISVETKGGNFDFRIGDLGEGGVERLDGNIVITQAPDGPRRKGQAQGRKRVPITEIPNALLGTIEAERITEPDRQSDWPVITHAADGALWAAYLQWDGAESDAVYVKRWPVGGEWSEPVMLDDGCWDHYSPAISARGDGVLVAWSGQSDGNFEVYAAEVSAGGVPGEVRQLSDAPYADFNVRAASNADGDATVVWQSMRSGRGDIYARRLVGDKWRKELRVSRSPASDWEPSIAVAADGKMWIAWDTYDAGNYDVCLRPLGKKLGKLVRVTTEPTAQFHASVAAAPNGDIWLAWDDGGLNWGKDFSRASRVDGSSGLHARRSIGLRVLSGGQLKEPAHSIADAMIGPLAQFAELPEIAFDGRGTPWVVFRHWTTRSPTEIFHEYAVALTDDGWSKPWLLANSSGRNSQRPSMSRAPDGGLVVAYASDGRELDNLPNDPVKALPFNVYTAELPEMISATYILAGEPVTLPPAGEAPSARARYVQSIADDRYTLLYGDCHRHTDIRGHGGVDGSILDTFRYARDAANLDFMGLGDHNQVTAGEWPDGLRDYHWWWSQKATDLMHCPPHFLGMYSYEHSLSRPAGHRNIIFLNRGAPLRLADRTKDSPDNLPPNLWQWIEDEVHAQPGQKCVIVPHTFASGPLADWNWPNAAFDCLLEIYQGARGSYEAWNMPEGEKRGPTQTDDPGHFAQDALEIGNTYGFVSFSDHGSTHNSWAGVYAEDVSRESLLDAMLARRTFAATDEIVMDITADDHAVGTRFPASDSPTFSIHVTAPHELSRIDIIKNGKYVLTQEVSGYEVTLEYTDNDTRAGESYYYVRVFQADPEAPDGDPEIAWASPFWVEYN